MRFSHAGRAFPFVLPNASRFIRFAFVVILIPLVPSMRPISPSSVSETIRILNAAYAASYETIRSSPIFMQTRSMAFFSAVSP